MTLCWLREWASAFQRLNMSFTVRLSFSLCEHFSASADSPLFLLLRASLSPRRTVLPATSSPPQKGSGCGVSLSLEPPD